jgi:hypothetical protein
MARVTGLETRLVVLVSAGGGRAGRDYRRVMTRAIPAAMVVARIQPAATRR